MRTIYLAGPMSGLPIEDIKARYTRTINNLKDHYDILHPMIDYTNFEAAPTETNDSDIILMDNGNPRIQRNFFGRDKWMVHQSDVILADWTLSNVTQKVSIGTVSEVAWAHAWGKYVVSIMPPHNPHEHAFIYELSDVIYDNYDQAIQYLQKLNTAEF